MVKSILELQSVLTETASFYNFYFVEFLSVVIESSLPLRFTSDFYHILPSSLQIDVSSRPHSQKGARSPILSENECGG